MKTRDKDGKAYWCTVLTPEEAEAVNNVAGAYGSKADFLRAIVKEKAGHMRDHHSYEQRTIGGSDMASLVFRFADGVHEVAFGEDGLYRAYIVDAECIIPAHYTLVCEGKRWLKVYDDNGKSFECMGDLIRVYTAGNFGCIIQILEDSE